MTTWWYWQAADEARPRAEGYSGDDEATHYRIQGQRGGGGSFRPDLIASIAANPIYKGYIACQGQLYPALHELIVTEDTWGRANEALALHRRHRCHGNGKDDHIHLLKGLVQCGHCNSTLTLMFAGRRWDSMDLWQARNDSRG